MVSMVRDGEVVSYIYLRILRIEAGPSVSVSACGSDAGIATLHH